MTSRDHPLHPSMTRHGSTLGSDSDVHRIMDTRLPPELAEKELVADIERVASENQRLAAAQGALRRDLVLAQDEVQRLKAHIRSIQTESDIQIRVLLEKIAKMKADYRDGSDLKKELEQAHKEAQNLVVSRQDLMDEIEDAKKELDAARLDIKNIPDMLAELDRMREEHQRLRTSFEHEKHLNIRKADQLYTMERELIGMAREAERLREEVTNVQKSLQSRQANPGPQTTAPSVVPHMNPDPSHQTMTIHSNGPYYSPYGMPPVQTGSTSYANSSTGAPPLHMGTAPVHGMIPYTNSSTTPGVPTVQMGAVPVDGSVPYANSFSAPPPPPPAHEPPPPPPDDPPPPTPAYDPPPPPAHDPSASQN